MMSFKFFIDIILPGQPVCRADNLPTFICQLSLKSGSLSLLEPSGPVKACNGIALPLPLHWTAISCLRWMVLLEGVKKHSRMLTWDKWNMLSENKSLVPLFHLICLCHVFCFGIIWAIFVSKQMQFCYSFICNYMCHISELTLYSGQLVGEWNVLY
jgi:hypothetical protein